MSNFKLFLLRDTLYVKYISCGSLENFYKLKTRVPELKININDNIFKHKTGNIIWSIECKNL